MGNTIFTVFLLALIGFFVGLLLAGAQKRKQRAAAPHGAAVHELDEAAKRQLIQLEQQLNSGLLTKEEYQTAREKLLRR